MNSARSPGNRWVWILAIALTGAAGVSWERHLAKARSAELDDLARSAAELKRTIKRNEAGIDDLKSQIRVWEAGAGEPPAGATSDRTGEITAWADRLNQLRHFLADHPEQAIPEMKLLTPQMWLFWSKTAKTDSDQGLRASAAQMRNDARALLMGKLNSAFTQYLADHDGVLPSSPAELGPLAGPEVDGAMLSRYRMLVSGRASDNQGNLVISEQVPPVDEHLDVRYYFGIDTFGSAMGWVPGELREGQQEARIAFKQANGRASENPADILPYVASPAIRSYLEATLAFAAANPAKSPRSLQDVQPYLATPESKAFAERLWRKSTP